MDTLRSCLKHLILFLIGGLVYLVFELLWRGHTHWSMFVVGGIAFILIGVINERFTYTVPLWKQYGIAMLMITTIEFLAGCILNLWLEWCVWSYTILDILGQISLPSMIGWYFLSAAGIVLDDLIRWKLFNEEKPHYTIF